MDEPLAGGGDLHPGGMVGRKMEFNGDLAGGEFPAERLTAEEEADLLFELGHRSYST